MNLHDKASLIITPNAYKASKIYAAKPNDGSGDLTFSRAGTAMRRNSSGLWESVASNIPRLSYPIGGGCPSWLFEPQTTCLIPNCNTFPGGMVKTTGITDSPIQGVNSVRITKDSAGIQYCVTYYSAIIASATNYALSLFFKYDGHDVDSSLEFNNGNDWGKNWKVNIEIRSTGITIVLQENCTAVLVAEANGWYRLEVSLTTGTVTTNTTSYLIKGAGANGASFLVCTSNLTQETNPSSPIITTGSNLTRLADLSQSSSVTGITSTSFTFYAYISSAISTSSGGQFLGVSEDASNYGLWLFTDAVNTSKLRVVSWTSSGLVEVLNIADGGDILNSKVALQKNGMDIKIFKNGVLIKTVTLTVDIPVPTRLQIFGGSCILRTKDILTFNSILTDAECIALTTP